mmetsp:Transcript_14015/g.58538  ORF Transcript_14015/g.58538 Transcript_14015/m.58538 type:complete len:270 (-) Transcript_14015:583-1392(-)
MAPLQRVRGPVRWPRGDGALLRARSGRTRRRSSPAGCSSRPRWLRARRCTRSVRRMRAASRACCSLSRAAWCGSWVPRCARRTRCLWTKAARGRMPSASCARASARPGEPRRKASALSDWRATSLRPRWALPASSPYSTPSTGSCRTHSADRSKKRSQMRSAPRRFQTRRSSSLGESRRARPCRGSWPPVSTTLARTRWPLMLTSAGALSCACDWTWCRAGSPAAWARAFRWTAETSASRGRCDAFSPRSSMIRQATGPYCSHCRPRRR